MTTDQLSAPAVSHTEPTKAELRWYGIGHMGIGFKGQANDFLVFFYTQVVGLSGSLAGLAVMFTAISDALSDPIVATYSDRLKSKRYGRRHPFLLGASIPLAVSYFAIWGIPDSIVSPYGMFFWLLIANAVHQLFATIYYVPYLALGAELSNDYEIRNRVVMQRSLWDRIGRAIAGTAILLLFFRAVPTFPEGPLNPNGLLDRFLVLLRGSETFENGQLNPVAYPRFAVMITFMLFAAAMVSAWGTRRRIPHLRVDTPPADLHPLRSMARDMRQAMQYRAFRAVFGAHVAMYIGWGVTGAMGLHMMTFFWKVDTNVLFIWGLGMTIGNFVGLPLWTKVASTWDKKPVYMTGLAGYIAFMAVPCIVRAQGIWVDESSPWHMILYVGLTGFAAHVALTGCGLMTGSMLADIADLDDLTHGRRREGIFFAVESFGIKMLYGFGSLIAGAIVDATGVAGADPKTAPDSVGNNLGMTFGMALLILMSISIFFMMRYDIDRERYASIRRDLDARNEAPASV